MVSTLPSAMHLIRLGSPVFGSDESKFAQEPPGRNSNANFHDQELTGYRQEHFASNVALLKQYLTFSVFPRTHVRSKPIHRQIALRGNPRLLDQFQHLAQADDVDRQRKQIQ